MSISDETLMAFADGELDEHTRREVELAMRQDPSIAEKVKRHKALRSNVFNAFASTLDEEVPQRLQTAARSGKVVHLDSVRPPRPIQQVPSKPRWSWPEWGALAATLVVGVLSGAVGTRGAGEGAQLAAFDAGRGALTAQGKLEAALTQQLASATPADAEVRLGLSFVSREGTYCRSFALPTAAGLACRSGDAWNIALMVEQAESGDGAYRQAGAAMPAALLGAIDERIAGQALDANAERAAQNQGWKR